MRQDKQRIHITCMMLILYALVLAHTAVAHQYDCEILDGLIPHTEKTDDPCFIGLQKTDLHFNVFSDDVNIENSKNGFKAVGIPHSACALDLIYPSYGIDRVIPVVLFLRLVTNYPQLSLRAPPFLSYIY